MAATWIVAANAGRARFFSQAHASAPAEEINDMVNAATRLRTADTETDELGQRPGSAGSRRGGSPSQSSDYEPHQTPGEHQTELFARSVAGYLQQGRHEHRFGQLRLAASPEFLGVLRKQLDADLKAVLKAEVAKDYTTLDGVQLLERLQAALP